MKEYAIAIQARTTSKRFPNKVLQMIGDKTVLEHVLSACRESASYINRHTHRTGVAVYVFLLVPSSDILMNKEYHGVKIIGGSENDVLSRYVSILKKKELSGIVRITADCPLIQPSIITKILKLGEKGEYDFISNAMPEYRTFLDGLDCEYMSPKLLRWLDENAKGKDREHVTSLAVWSPPKWAKIGHIFNNIDFFSLDFKLSIDTPEDLERVRKIYLEVQNKMQKWEQLNGASTINRFWSA